jgi:hypothetical protein
MPVLLFFIFLLYFVVIAMYCELRKVSVWLFGLINVTSSSFGLVEIAEAWLPFFLWSLGGAKSPPDFFFV